MSDCGRFCVRFSGMNENGPIKTKIFQEGYSTSDVQDAWRTVHNEEPPEDIHLIIPGSNMSGLSTYSLNDKNDFDVVMAMAEDQYRAYPSDPLHIILTRSAEYKPNTPPSSNPSPDQHLKLTSSSFNIYSENHVTERNSPLMESNQSNVAPPHSEPAHEKDDDEDVIYDLSLKKDQERPTAPSDRPENRMRKIFPSRGGNRKRIPDRFMENELNSNNKRLALSHSVAPETPTLSHSVVPEIVNRPGNFEGVNLMNSPQGNSSCNNEKASNGTKFDSRYVQGQTNVTSTQLVPNAKRAKKAKRKTKKVSCVKRMRSSPSQSNITFHFKQSLEFMKLPEEEKKKHNSAHRSHWKHLSHAMSLWPNFCEAYKHKKYDEWSSEARDIYAITRPDNYRWSFLTLAKQGDQLCQRIMDRVERIRATPRDLRLPWCPPDDVLQTTWENANKRLDELKKIRENRQKKMESLPPPTNACQPETESTDHPPTISAASLLTPNPVVRPNLFGNGPQLLSPRSFLPYTFPFNPCPPNISSTLPSFRNSFTPFGMDMPRANTEATRSDIDSARAVLLHRMVERLNHPAFPGASNTNDFKEENPGDNSVPFDSEEADPSHL